MLRLIPYRHFTITTFLALEDAVNLLSQAVAPEDFGLHWFWEDRHGFEGKVSQKGFTIRRQIAGRDSFLPVAYGGFIATATGTEIDVRIHPFLPVLIMFLLWSGWSFWILLNDWPRMGACFVPAIILMGLIPWIMTVLEFAIEEPRSEKFIANVFAKYIVPPTREPRSMLT